MPVMMEFKKEDTVMERATATVAVGFPHRYLLARGILAGDTTRTAIVTTITTGIAITIPTCMATIR